jgi:hypothetical protein
MNRQPTPLHGLVTALVVSVLSFGFVCLALGSMFSNVDSRLMLTVTDTFSGLKEIRDVLNSTASYLSIFNPPGVDHVPFPAGPETLEELEDLVRRGLMPGDALGRFQAVDPASDPSLLHRLMVASWCSSGRAIPNVLPAARTPGCQCIADAYLDLVGTTRSAQNYSISGYAQVGGYNTTVLVGGTNQTVLVNGTNRTVLVGAVNTTVWLNWTNQTLWVPAVVLVPVDVRMRVADRVYRCWDQRQVRWSRQCGDSCKVHLLGLPLFANIVLFLVCMSYLMFMQLGRSGWELYVIKLMVVGLGIALSIPFFVRYIEANVLNLAGVVVCLFYLVVSLHSELDAQSSSDKQYPSLTVSFLVNLPLVLSAHAVQLGVSGYGRDIWASLSFGACGGLLGVLLQVSFCLVLFFALLLVFSHPVSQRYVWVCSYWVITDTTSQDLKDVARIALSAAFVCVQVFLLLVAFFGFFAQTLFFAQILFLLLFVAYRNDGSPYAGSSWVLQVFYQIFMWFLAFLYQRDANDREKHGTGLDKFTFVQSTAIFATALVSASLAVVAVVDVTSHSGN